MKNVNCLTIVMFISILYFPIYTIAQSQSRIDIEQNSSIKDSIEQSFSKMNSDTTNADENKSLSEMDLQELSTIRISPFDVSSYLDIGYRASNSVSASRFDTPIRNLPFAIQAFTKSFIIDQKPVNIFDVARYSPGVTYRSNDFNEGNVNMAIRGFAISSTPGNIQILRDGFHGPSILDLTNISRVEVVKGPSSFLYGQVAPGGIINVITKNPQHNFQANLNAIYGSYNQYRLEGDVTGPAAKSLYYRLAASYNKDMNYWKPYDAASWDVAPSLLWQPNKQLSVTLKFEQFYKNETPQLMQKPGYNTQAGVIPTASDPNLSGVDVPGLPDDWNSMSDVDYRKSNTSNLSAWIDYILNDHWNIRTGYSHLEYKIDALASGNLGMANNKTFLQGRRLRHQTYTNSDDNLEAQIGGTYNFDFTSMRLLLGVQYIDRRFINQAGQALNDPALGSDPTGSPLPLWDLRNPATWNRSVNIPLSSLTAVTVDQFTKYKDKSIYAGMNFGLLKDELLLLIGARLTSTESQLTNNQTKQAQPKSTASIVTPQFGALYKVLPKLSIYASYAESFVPGTQLLKNPDKTTKTAEPTKGQGYDIGIKSDLFDGNFSGTLTFFDITNKNIVNDLAVTDSTGTITIYNVQSGEQRSYGIELDATITPDYNWQIYFSFSYLLARITEFSGRDSEILSNDLPLNEAEKLNYKSIYRFHDAPLQMSAPFISNFWTSYNFTKTKLKGLNIGGGFNYVYDQALLPDGPKSSHQTYLLLNAVVGYSTTWYDIPIRIDIMGKNLMNEHYRPSQSSRSRPREFISTFTVSL